MEDSKDDYSIIQTDLYTLWKLQTQTILNTFISNVFCHQDKSLYIFVKWQQKSGKIRNLFPLSFKMTQIQRPSISLRVALRMRSLFNSDLSLSSFPEYILKKAKTDIFLFDQPLLSTFQVSASMLNSKCISKVYLLYNIKVDIFLLKLKFQLISVIFFSF